MGFKHQIDSYTLSGLNRSSNSGQIKQLAVIMKLLLDFLPIIIFFGVYKYTNDIIIATAVLIPATILQVGYTWIKTRSIEKMQLAVLALVVIMGGATVIFQNEAFIQWKPTVANWLFALVFLGSHFIGNKPIIQRMLAASIELAQPIWNRLSFAWIFFFIIAGTVNTIIAPEIDPFNLKFSTDTWVDFKLFGMLGMTLVFIIAQGIYLSRHIQETDIEISESKQTDK